MSYLSKQSFPETVVSRLPIYDGIYEVPKLEKQDYQSLQQFIWLNYMENELIDFCFDPESTALSK